MIKSTSSIVRTFLPRKQPSLSTSFTPIQSSRCKIHYHFDIHKVHLRYRSLRLQKNALVGNAFNVPHGRITRHHALFLDRVSLLRAASLAVGLLTHSFTQHNQKPSVERAYAATNLAHRCLMVYTYHVSDEMRVFLHVQRTVGHHYLAWAFVRAGNIKLAMACFEKAAVDRFHHAEQQEHLGKPLDARCENICKTVNKRLGWHHIPKDAVFCVTGRVPSPNEGPVYEYGVYR